MSIFQSFHLNTNLIYYLGNTGQKLDVFSACEEHLMVFARPESRQQLRWGCLPARHSGAAALGMIETCEQNIFKSNAPSVAR